MTIWRLTAWGMMILAMAALATARLAAQEKKPAAKAKSAAEPKAGAKADEADADAANPNKKKSDDAADDDKGDDGNADDDAGAATPEGTEFDKLLAEWKQLITSLRELSLKYATARPGKDRNALKEEYAKLLSEGEELEPKFIAGALSAYASDTKKYREVGDFLASIVRSSVEADDYESALEPAKVLIDHGYGNPRIYNDAGIAAFRCNHFDDAEKYLKQAEKKSSIDNRGRECRSLLDDTRQKWLREKEIREAEAAADDLPRVLLKTNKGDIVVELFENEAPNTVANFINLVEQKKYDDVVFHRVLPDFMAQGGDPDGTGRGGPGYKIACECYEPNHRMHFRGSLSMAHSGKNTGGSQFFITFKATSHLDGKHTVFGRVVEGMNVLAKLQRIDPDHPEPGVKPDRIVEAKVLRKREHEYVPDTIAGK